VESLVGRTLGKYELTALIGGGGMATVYKGRHPGLDQQVAVKILHPFLSTDASFVDRFRREAHAVATLRHPNIVRVLDSDHEDHLYYMVMEYIGGPTLSAVLAGRRAGGGLSLPEIGRIFPPLCSAIDYAAGRGMVHRDIKPANIIMSDDGEPILTDYGIAKIVGSTSLTSPGTVVGSAHYMSPEQAQGQECDVRSDLYSLGIVLFECLAGVVPFDGDTTVTVLVKHISAPVPSIRDLRPNLPPALEPMLARALAKLPRDRYEMGAIFAEELLVALNPSKAVPAVTELVASAAPLPTPPPPPATPPSTPSPPPPLSTTPSVTPAPPSPPPASTSGEQPVLGATGLGAAIAAEPPLAEPLQPESPQAESLSVTAAQWETPELSTPPPPSVQWDSPPQSPPLQTPTRAEYLTSSEGTPPFGQYGLQATETPGVPYPGVPSAADARGGAPPRRRNRRRIIIVAALAIVLVAAIGTGVSLAFRGGTATPEDFVTTTTGTTFLSTTTSASTTSTTVQPTTTSASTTSTTVQPTTTSASTTSTTARPTTTTKKQTTTTKKATTTTRSTSPPDTIGPGTTSPPDTIGPG
jgi:serine/threonine protein kinase